MDKGMRFHHVSLYVDDYDSSMKLYQALGFTPYCHWVWEEDINVYKKGGRNCFLSLDGDTFVELHEVPDRYALGVIGHFCFHVDDVDEVYRIAMENGAKPVKEPGHHPLYCQPKPVLEARTALFLGPSGEQVEIINWGGYDPFAP